MVNVSLNIPIEYAICHQSNKHPSRPFTCIALRVLDSPKSKYQIPKIKRTQIKQGWASSRKRVWMCFKIFFHPQYASSPANHKFLRFPRDSLCIFLPFYFSFPNSSTLHLHLLVFAQENTARGVAGIISNSYLLIIFHFIFS